jgi:hypothetical protein
MFRLQMWQWVVVGVVALGCVGAMSFTVAGMFGRRAVAPAALRDGTAFESAAASATAPVGVAAFDGFSYRVPARFAGRVRVMVGNGAVSIAGPRAPKALYEWWIWIQALLLALVPAAIVGAAVRLDWRWLLLALAVFIGGLAFSALGAGIWPGLGEMDWLVAGTFKAVEYPVAAVSDVKIGKGWADGGIDMVLMSVKAGIDSMAADHAVSWSAPDENGGSVRYAVHLPRAEDATALAALLGGH